MPGSPRFLLVAALLGAVPSANFADESPSQTDNVNELVEELDSDQFAERQAASEELSRLGSGAFPALEKAARSESRETSQRAIEILKKHFEGDDTATKQAARETLERLAADTSTRGGRQAYEVLKPPPPPVFAPAGIVRVAQGNLRVQPAAVVQNVKRVQVRNANGVKEVEVEENGRKVKVVDDPKGGLQAEITETKNGKETTQKYSAKDADELKQKSPEAHKIYEQFGKQAPNGVRVQIGGAIIPQQAPAKPLNEAEAKQLQKAANERTLKAIDMQIEQLRQTFPDRPDIQRHIERLQDHRKLLEKQQADMEKAG